MKSENPSPGLLGIKKAFIENDLDDREPEATINAAAGSSLSHDDVMRGIVDRADLWGRELFADYQKLPKNRMQAAIATVGLDAFMAGVTYGVSGGFSDIRTVVDLANSVKGRSLALDTFMEEWLAEVLTS